MEFSPLCSDLPVGGASEDDRHLLEWTCVAGLIDSVYGLMIRNFQNLIDFYSLSVSTASPC